MRCAEGLVPCIKIRHLVCFPGDLCRHHRGVRASPAPSCCGSALATPSSRWSGHRRHPGRHARSPTLYPSLAGAYPDLVFVPLRRGSAARARPRLPRPAPRRLAGDGARTCSGTVGARSSTWPPTSGCRTPRCTRSGTARPTPRPNCSAEFVYGLPELFRAEITRRTLVAAPGCYPTAGALALAPLCGPGSSRRTGIIVDAASRACRAPADRPSRPPRSAPSTRTSPPTGCSTTATRPRSSRSRVGRRPGAVHPAPGADEPGHPRHLLRPPDRRRRTTEALLELQRDGLRRRAVRRRQRRLAVHQGHARLEHRPRHRPLRRRTGWVVAIARLDNLVKGASGQAVQCANLLARPRPRPPASPSWGSTRERHRRARGFVAAGIACRHQAVAATPTSRWSPPPTAGRSPAAAVFTQNKMTAAPGASPPDATSRHRRAGRGGDPQQRQRQRRHRRRRASTTPSACAPARPPSSAARADEVLVCSTGLIGIPLPIDAIAGAASRRWSRGRRADGGGATRPRPSAPPTPIARRPSSAGDGFTRRRHGQGRGDARARTWRRCSPCSPPTPPPSPRLQRGAARRRRRQLQRARHRRLHVHQRHRHPAGQRRGRAAVDRPRSRAPRSPGVRRPGRADGRRRRGRHQGRARSTVTGARVRRRRRARGARKVAESQLVQVLLVRRGPVLGPHRQRARQRRHRLRPRQVSVCLRRRHRVPSGGIDGRPRRGGAWPRTWRERHLEIDRRPRPRRRARLTSSPTTSPTRTSTRTWARHEPTGPTADRPADGRSSRRCRTSSASAARRSS